MKHIKYGQRWKVHYFVDYLLLKSNQSVDLSYLYMYARLVYLKTYDNNITFSRRRTVVVRH